MYATRTENRMNPNFKDTGSHHDSDEELDVTHVAEAGLRPERLESWKLAWSLEAEPPTLHVASGRWHYFGRLFARNRLPP
jgi:hypothetical protein